MKKILLGLSFILVLSTSCKKDSDDSTTITGPLNERILGTWTGEESVGTATIIRPGLSDTTTNSNLPISWMKITFKNDSTYQVDSAGVFIAQDKWFINSNDQLIIDGTDTATVSLLNSTNLNINFKSTEYLAAWIIHSEQTIKFTK